MQATAAQLGDIVRSTAFDCVEDLMASALQGGSIAALVEFALQKRQTLHGRPDKGLAEQDQEVVGCLLWSLTMAPVQGHDDPCCPQASPCAGE